MGTKNFSNANDLITFSRSSAGTALRKIAYGPELVTNGTFDDSSALNDWEEFSGILSVASQKLRVTQTTGSNPSAGQSVNTTVGKIYSLSLDYFPATADARIFIKSTDINGSILYNEANLNTDGTYENTFVATTSAIYIQAIAQTNTAGHYAEFDNISVKEVLFDQPNAPLTLFNHPAGIPRIEYDADGNVLGLLVEESRTNLLTYSEDFDNSAWVKLFATVSSDSAIAPDGTLTADKFVNNTGSNGYVYRGGSLSAGSNTFSVFAKAAEESLVLLERAGGVRGVFNIATGVVTSEVGGAVGQITDVGNGWYLCSITFTEASAGSDNVYIGRDSGVKDGVSGIYIWGAQLEAGAFPTSYIPTAGATATRSADVASIPVADFGYNQEAGTWLMEWDTVDTDGVVAKYILSSGTSARVMYNNAGTSAYYSFDGSAVSAYTAPTPITLDGSLIKAAYAENESGSSVAHTGVLGTGSVNSDLLSNYNSTYGWSIGNLKNNQGFLNGHIKSIKYFPRKLSAAQLQELTT